MSFARTGQERPPAKQADMETGNVNLWLLN